MMVMVLNMVMHMNINMQMCRQLPVANTYAAKTKTDAAKKAAKKTPVSRAFTETEIRVTEVHQLSPGPNPNQNQPQSSILPLPLHSRIDLFFSGPTSLDQLGTPQALNNMSSFSA